MSVIGRSVWLAALLVATLFTAGCDRGGESAGNQAPAGASASGPSSQRPASLAAIPRDQSRSGKTDRGLYRVDVTPEPNPIPFQELFRLEVSITESDGETPVEEAKLDDVRAIMPAHEHGMNTSPRIEARGPGAFTVEGMRFHMQGRAEDGHWVLELVVNGPEGVDRARFDLQCCRPQ